MGNPWATLGHIYGATHTKVVGKACVAHVMQHIKCH